MTKIVSMAVLNDYGMFSDRDEEYAALVVRFTKYLKPLKVRSRHLDRFNPSPGVNLVLYDYGGMMPGSQGLIEFNTRAVLEWAVNNPKKLLVVTSTFTWECYVDTMARDMDLRNSEGDWKIINVELDNGLDGDPIPNWFKEQFK